MKILETLVLGLAVISATPAIANAECPKEKAINVLALNMYHEARGEGPTGKQMVGEVTLNRVESDRYPDTICEVVYQRKQFSWTHTKKDHTPYEKKKWKEALEIAEGLLNGKLDRFDNGATHFLNPNAVSRMPKWTEKFKMVGRVGNHVFYDMDV